MIRNITLPDSLSFSDYFKLNFYPEEILNYFDYSFEMKLLDFPKTTSDLAEIESLEKRLIKGLPYITFDNEMARREFLIAPVLMDLIDYTKSNLKVAYTLTINNQLRGELDYFLESRIKSNDQVTHQFLVIEAKDENLERGFKQLAVEMVALTHVLNEGQRYIYGAVSIGKIWQFGVLDRQSKSVIQDLHLYRVPDDLRALMGILVGILTGENF
ncbi:MAG: hypothetical protein HC916_06955 [Coleofasciculaceae cyanobacterium SM2_1_6]|nr:hypothetical protein [Coleofasciculaceae cyanobacterium SM2_1_6]